MKYQNKILTVIILIILFVGCASSKRRMDSDSREKDDSLEFLIDYADLSKVRNNDFSETEIESFSYRFDKLCDDDIFVTKNHTIERLQKKTEKIFDLIDVFETNNKIVNNISYSISSNELIFKVLVATQERLKEAYQYNENHAGYTFDVKIAMTLPYIQTNQMCSDLKSKLLLNTINLLPEISTNIEKERCWLAIDRMIEKIDIKKSESGYDPFQRGPEGIYTSNGEILSLLNAYHEREVDNSIIEYSGEILNKIIERLDRKLDKQFWHNVRSSRTMNREFQNQRARLADEKPSVAIDSSNAKTADEWFFLGYYAEQSDLKLNYYSKALELDPEHAAAYNNRGNILRSLGQNEKAIEDLSLAIALDPLYAPAYINRGTMYRDVHEYSKAIRDYDKALELDSSFTIIFYNRAACHKSLGLYEECISDYTKAISYDTQNPKLYNYRGEAYRVLDKNDDAIQDFNRAIELNQDYAVAYNNRGRSYNILKKHREAIQDHKKAIELKPNYADAYYNLGLVYWERARWKDVIAAWEKCLEIDPDHQLAKKYLPEAKELSKPRIITIKKKVYKVKED